MSSQKKYLRQRLRHQRRSLSPVEQQFHALACCKRAQPLLESVGARQVALYLANDSELNPEKLIQICWDQGLKVYLPVIDPHQSRQLLFAQYTPETTLKSNRFAIPEPDSENATTISVADLDIIFMPLVAFTEAGDRLGMGGGYYDNTLNQQNSHRARFIGLAYDFQKLPSLPVQPWDIKLDGIATDKELYHCPQT